MIKKFIVSFCLLFSLAIFAQEGTSSPYSFYGIGDIKFKGNIENRSMGGISVLPDSIHLNLQNPAHFATLKLTSFAIGGTYGNTKLNTESAESKAKRVALDYLAIGVPIGKLGFAFGLVPYSSVGYKLQKLSSDANPIFSRYTGLGGVNRVFFGLGYQITKKLNFGADVQYNFGTIKTENLRFQEGLQYGTREKNTSDIQGVNFDLGLSYQTKIGKKHSFFSSMTYTPEAKLKLDNARVIEIVQFTSAGTIKVIETNTIPVNNTTIKLPSKFSFGSGFGQLKKWMVGAEVTLLNNSVVTNRFVDIDGAKFENSVRYSLGGFFIPNYNSYSSYWKKIVYRGGIRYENTGLVIQNPGYPEKSITDFAANVGFGFPVGGTFSNINVGLEVGKRGTKFANLVEENYINLSVGLSFSDRWFIKRKYD
ncbi:MAG TPA: hypothetical protein PKN96_01110 [Flavobacterium sp.]|uniref:hypothetical protein n=1 Tax=Flavobacterium sp. TaxID=239 RepID=UPI002CD150EB|nr:hypothetical protein [Flavobacterium sp.]HNP31870.1 hypothetical protein [Flavobacterium sp.]